MSELPIYAPPSGAHNVYEAIVQDPLVQKIVLAPADATPKSPDAAQFYCSYCNKSFSSANTWQTHQNSAKHLKEMARRQTGPSSAQNTVSPDKSRSSSSATTPNSSPKSSQTIPNPKAGKEPLPGVNDAEVLKASQMLQLIKQMPNDQYDKLFRLLMMAGQLFFKNYYLKDGAFCLEKLIAVVSTQRSKENSDGLCIIDAKEKTSWLESAVVLHKAYLYLSRAYRDFDKDLVLEFCYESLLNLVNEQIIDNLEQMVLIGNYKILSEEISNVTTSMLAAANIIDGKSDDINDEGFSLHVYTFMNEFAGHSCEIISNTLGVILYAIAIEIAKRKNWNIRYVDSLRRLIKVVNGLEVNWLAIDYLLDGFYVINNDSYLLEALYTAIDLDDRVRIKRILNIEPVRSFIKNSEEVKLLLALCSSYVKDDLDELIQLKKTHFLSFDLFPRLEETFSEMKRALAV
jgi:hypothetical protein